MAYLGLLRTAEFERPDFKREIANVCAAKRSATSFGTAAEILAKCFLTLPDSTYIVLTKHHN